MSISEYLNAVLRDWQVSQDYFPRNRIANANWPIPFFGNPAKALVATVGVNPASGEFEPSRGWAMVYTASAWKERLRDYFKINVPPHIWFDPWRTGLKLLAISYEDRTAAHFDVSYRTTTAMLKNEATDRLEFGRMVNRDVEWLFRLLPLCANLRLLLTFGPILRPDGTKANLTHFLKKHAPHHGFIVLQNGHLQHAATRRVFFIHEADTYGEPSVTCRVVKNLTTHRGQLLSWLDCPGLVIHGDAKTEDEPPSRSGFVAERTPRC
jgi:hypothetical protein